MRSQNLTSSHFVRWDMRHSNDGDYEDYTLQGCDTVQSGGGLQTLYLQRSRALITEGYGNAVYFPVGTTGFVSLRTSVNPRAQHRVLVNAYRGTVPSYKVDEA